MRAHFSAFPGRDYTAICRPNYFRPRGQTKIDETFVLRPEIKAPQFWDAIQIAALLLDWTQNCPKVLVLKSQTCGLEQMLWLGPISNL